MSRNTEEVTPSVDRYQPQHVIGRQHAHLQLSSPPSEHLQQPGNRNTSREDDVIAKMASQVTHDVINSAVRLYVAGEQSLSGDVGTGSDQNRKQYSSAREREQAAATSGATQPSRETQASLTTFGTREVDDKRSTGSQSTDRSTDSKPEVAASTGDAEREAEALQDIARLQALTRQLRAAVAESRNADGLPVNLGDETDTARTSAKDLEQASPTINNQDNNDVV